MKSHISAGRVQPKLCTRCSAFETPRSLSRLLAEHERIDFEGGSAELLAQLRELPGVASVTTPADGQNRIQLNDEKVTRDVLEFLVRAGITSIRTSRPSLEEVYVHVMSRG